MRTLESNPLFEKVEQNPPFSTFRKSTFRKSGAKSTLSTFRKSTFEKVEQNTPYPPFIAIVERWNPSIIPLFKKVE